MPVDLQIARPFTLVAADGQRYSWGIGFYPAVSDEIAALPFVRWHTQSAVRARGGWCAQKRPPLMGGGHLQMLWLDGDSHYAGEDIVAGPAPVFADSPSLQFFPKLDHGALPDFYPLGPDAAGEIMYRRVPGYDMIMHRMPQPLPKLPDVVRMHPGDPSPPVTKSAPPHAPIDDEAEVGMLQAEQLRVVQGIAARNAAELPAAPAPPQQDALDLSRFTDRDPRQSVELGRPVPRPEMPPGTGVWPTPPHAVYEEILRARLDRRAPRDWAV
jgi:hypothetical protein